MKSKTVKKVIIYSLLAATLYVFFMGGCFIDNSLLLSEDFLSGFSFIGQAIVKYLMFCSTVLYVSVQNYINLINYYNFSTDAICFVVSVICVYIIAFWGRVDEKCRSLHLTTWISKFLRKVYYKKLFFEYYGKAMYERDDKFVMAF